MTPEAQKAALPPIANQAVANEVPNSSHHGGQKNKGKPFCYRCHTKGHTIHECTAVLYCDLCCGDHVTKICPNMKKMNSTAIPCGYAVEGLGFYFIPVAENPKVNLEEKSALVRVLEGSLTADQLAVELEKLLPGKNKWVIEEKGKDAFITNFPSSDLLDTMVNWGTMDTKSVKGKIRFEKGVENDVYKYEIDKVWVQFRGLPKEFREFPIIWAIGSILGVPRAVDTKFTKKFGRSRMKVAMLDPNLIPNLVDVVIGDFVYELQFRVEQHMPNGEPEVIDMDSTMDDENPKEDKNNREKPNEDMDVDGKKDDIQDPNSAPRNQLPNSGQHNGAVQQKEDGAGSVVQQNKSGKASNKPVIVLTQNELFSNGNGQWKANLIPPQTDSGLINKLKLQNGGTMPPVRSSKRNATTADQDSVERASNLKARKNLDTEPDKGKQPQPCSFISRDDSSLLNISKSLGVVLGDNDQDILNSLKSLRDVEFNRMNESLNLLEENKVVVEDASTFCSNDDNIDLDALNQICSEISEGLGDGGCDHVCLQIPVSQKKHSRPKKKKKNKCHSR